MCTSATTHPNARPLTSNPDTERLPILNAQARVSTSRKPLIPFVSQGTWRLSASLGRRASVPMSSSSFGIAIDRSPTVPYGRRGCRPSQCPSQIVALDASIAPAPSAKADRQHSALSTTEPDHTQALIPVEGMDRVSIILHRQDDERGPGPRHYPAPIEITTLPSQTEESACVQPLRRKRQ